MKRVITIYDEKVREACAKQRTRWHEKSKEERRENSRDGACEIMPDGLFRKWCENCGNEYVCVNETRHLCEKCHWTKVYGGGYNGMVLFSKKSGGSYVDSTRGMRILSVPCPKCGADAVRKEYKFANARPGVDDGRRHGLHFYLTCESCGLITDWQPVTEAKK